MEFISDLPAYILNMAIMCLVLLFDRLIQIPTKNHPMTIIAIMIERLNKKVFPSSRRPIQQQYIAGTLTLLMTILPWLLISVLFIQLTEFPLFFEGFLFWLCLNMNSCVHDLKKIEYALHKKQNTLAKDRLQKWVLRDTDRLSEIGITKATCETLLLRNCYNYQALILWFIVVGPYATLVVRLVLEIYQQSNSKLARYQFFGLPARYINHLLMWIPSRITGVTYILSRVNTQFITVAANTSNWPFTNSKWLLACSAACLKIRLGGAVMYEEKKEARPHIASHYPQPSIASIKASRQLILTSNMILILTIVAVSMLTYLSSNL